MRPLAVVTLLLACVGLVACDEDCLEGYTCLHDGAVTTGVCSTAEI